MARLFTLSLVAAVLGFALAGCGSTNYGPNGPPKSTGAGGQDASTRGQDPHQQPEQGGLKTPAYTAAHDACSLYGLDELARQNGVKATADAVAKAYMAGETTPAGQKQAYDGCIDAIKGK
jgi:hypothetical protein